MKKVIVVGGGYAGIKALQTFAKANIKAKVTLIDHHTYHYLQTESYDLVASTVPIEETFIYLPTLVKGIDKSFEFIHDRALEVKENRLICEKSTYEFDYLLIATGSVTRFIEGFAKKGEFSLGVKSLRAALKVKQFFEKELFERLEPQSATKSFTIAVIGGGLSGIEIASQMQHSINNYTKNNALACGKIKIKLVSKDILKELPPKVREKSIKRVKSLGVEFVPALVEKVEGKELQLDNGDKLAFEFAVFAGGIVPSPFIQRLNFRKNRAGFLKPDKFLRVADNVFVAGDCAEIKKGDSLVPPTAQSAEQSGKLAAKNIINSLQNRPLAEANIKLYGLAIALGGRYALAIAPTNIVIEGFLAYLGKKGIEKFYKLPLKRKANQGLQHLLKTSKAPKTCPQPLLVH